MSEVPKKRAPNFSAREKSALLNIIYTYKGIIENKKTDSVTWRQKDEAWSKITSLFNSQTPENHPRTKESLRKLYDNIKKNVRKEVALEKKEILKTGGGPEENPNRDDMTELTLGILNEKTVFGLNNPYDCDSENHDETSVQLSAGTVILDVADEDIFSPDPEPSTRPISLEAPSQAIASTKANKIDNFEPLSLLEKDSEKEKNKEIMNLPELTPKTKNQNTNWGDYSALKLRTPVTTELKQNWTKRRRPNIQQLSSSQLSEEYLKLAKIKQEYFEAEKQNAARRHQREEELFQLQKRKLELEVALAENELKKYM